jgi:hypothetical protein
MLFAVIVTLNYAELSLTACWSCSSSILSSSLAAYRLYEYGNNFIFVPYFSFVLIFRDIIIAFNPLVCVSFLLLAPTEAVDSLFMGRPGFVTHSLNIWALVNYLNADFVVILSTFVLVIISEIYLNDTITTIWISYNFTSLLLDRTNMLTM